MTEPIPLWEDWRFWQIIVTGVLAFLGFTFGTWVKYGFDRRRDDRLRREKTRVLAVAISGELDQFAKHCRINADALRTIDAREMPIDHLRGLVIGDWTVFDAAAGQIGLFGTDLPNGVTVLERVMSTRRQASIFRAVIDSFCANPAIDAIADAEASRLADLFEGAGKNADEAVAALREHEPQ